MTSRAGAVSIPELVLVTVLFAIVLGGIARLARDHNRLAGLQRDRLRFEEAVRTATVVLGAELRFLTDADVAGVSADSVRIRAFRGGGTVCGGDPSVPMVVYTGMRDPDPTRDSVLLLGPGPDTVMALTGVRQAAGCGGSLELSLDDVPSTPPSYLLVFETGAYHLSDGAFRYRRGDGGRQPLTETVLNDLMFEPTPFGLGVRLGPNTDSLPRLSPDPRSGGISALNRSVIP